MQIQDRVIRSRTPTPGPELEFTQAALESIQEVGIWGGEPDSVFFQEPALPTGFPDLVGVLLSRKELWFTPERLKLRGKHLQLLHYIFSTHSTDIETAAEALLWNRRSIEVMIQDLKMAGLVRQYKKRLRCATLAEVFVARRIVAVEAKLDKWGAAIRQAVANTWFASHSFILLPEKRWSLEVRESAAHFGIGVLTFDGVKTRKRLPAKRQHIPSSYGSWLVNEWTIRQAGNLASQC